MKIVGKEYFSRLPEWTVFALCDDGGEPISPLHIKDEVGRRGNKFYMLGEGIMCPNFIYDYEEPNDVLDLYEKGNPEDHEYKSEIAWTDTHLCDINDNQKFMILNQVEVLEIIKELWEAHRNFISGDYPVIDEDERDREIIEAYKKLKGEDSWNEIVERVKSKRDEYINENKE